MQVLFANVSKFFEKNNMFVPERVYALEYEDEKFLNHTRNATGSVTLVLSLGLFGVVKSLGKGEKED